MIYHSRTVHRSQIFWERWRICCRNSEKKVFTDQDLSFKIRLPTVQYSVPVTLKSLTANFLKVVEKEKIVVHPSPIIYYSQEVLPLSENSIIFSRLKPVGLPNSNSCFCFLWFIQIIYDLKNNPTIDTIK